MIKEWLLARILKNKIVLFENENYYFVINDIYFEDGKLGIRDLTSLNEYTSERQVADYMNRITNENEQLKSENKRMTDKLNSLALELLNYEMVTMGKATEISEMCYYDFLKFRKENGNPMELEL